MTAMDTTYRKMATSGATGIALLISLYDTLAGNLRRAAEAERRNNLERRGTELSHALMVIGFLQDRVARGSGGDLATQLTVFYVALRRTILQAQAKRTPELLEQAMTQILEIRAQWQAMEFRREPSGPEILAPAQTQRYGAVLAVQAERRQSSWSA